MKLSRTAGYAVQATLLLAQTNSQGPIPCSRLAAEGQMPERFLLQILRSLVTRGILESTRGVEGGYRLRRQPEQISLLDVIEAVDGPITVDVPKGDGISPDAQSRLSAALSDVVDVSKRQLAAIKLSNLMVHARPVPRRSINACAVTRKDANA